MPLQPTPPKPRLTLRVGVTGHRPNRLDPGSVLRLRHAILSVILEIRKSLEDVASESAEFYSQEPPRLIVVSALAEGADRLLAEIACELNLELWCPRPFRRETYMSDFLQEQSQEEFKRFLSKACVFELNLTRSEENLAYETSGLLVLRQSDLVIAVWDGEPGAGKGGTHDIIRHAATAGIPLIRFDHTGNGPWHAVAASGTLQEDDLLTGDQYDTVDHGGVDRIVRCLVEPPSVKTDPDARASLIDFYAETEKRINKWLAYPLLLWIVAARKGVWKSRHPESYQQAATQSWKAQFWSVLSRDGDIASPAEVSSFVPDNVFERLQPRFAWSDGLAVFYGQAYRSNYISTFLLGAVAVFFAVVPLPVDLAIQIMLGHEASARVRNFVEFGASIMALAAIGRISFLVWHGRQVRRHDKWLDYRLLAERLRVIRVLSLTCSNIPELRMPHSSDGPGHRSSWVSWYLRATIREIGMPKGVGDAAFVRTVRRVLIAAELQGQAEYHRSYASREKDVGERLEKLGVRLFELSVILTLFSLIYFLMAICFLPLSSDWEHVGRAIADMTMFFVALLPASGAALLSIRTQGEFERNAKLADATCSRLLTVLKSVEADDRPTFSSVARAVDLSASILTGELSDWRFIFRGKPLTLPG